ncbi:MAG: ABC transporter permease [Verrucomicrobiales bacterium]
MRVFTVLFGKEIKAFFLSPIAYVVLALVMVINGFSFKAAMTILETAPGDGGLVRFTFNAPWFWLSYFFIFPLVTMRLFAEEQKLGTLEALLTAPVRTGQLVAAKYLAALVFYCILWLPSLANFYIFQWITAGAGDIRPGELLGSYSILFLMGMFNLSIGCFSSSLSSNQIIAAILGFTLSLMHFLLGTFALDLAQNVDQSLKNIVQYFASAYHSRMFAAGVLDSRPAIYYATATALILFVTHQVVEFRRWRT